MEVREPAGKPITAKLTRAPVNNAPIGRLKFVTQNRWFAARPSGTEDIYKVYAENFKGERTLATYRVLQEAFIRTPRNGRDGKIKLGRKKA